MKKSIKRQIYLNVFGSDIRSVTNWDLVSHVEGLRTRSWNDPKRLCRRTRCRLGGSETGRSIPHLLQHCERVDLIFFPAGEE